MQQQLVVEAVKVQKGEKEQQVLVQDAEIARREKELIATVLKPAEIERQRIETLAGAEKQRLIAGSRRKGEQYPRTGRGRSRDHLQEGRSRSQGNEREGRGVPGVQPGRCNRQTAHGNARDSSCIGGAAVAGGSRSRWFPLAMDGSAGLNKVTGDIAQMAAQVPALFEALSGMNLQEMLSKVRLIGDKSPKPGNGEAGTTPPAK